MTGGPSVDSLWSRILWKLPMSAMVHGLPSPVSCCYGEERSLEAAKIDSHELTDLTQMRVDGCQQ